MGRLLLHFIQRVTRDHLLTEAASLSFKALLALLPALLLVVMEVAGNPSFAELREELTQLAAGALSPEMVTVISRNAGELGTIAGMTPTALAVLAVLTLWIAHSLDGAFSRIWGGGRRWIGYSIILYTSMLLLGPVAAALVAYTLCRVIILAMTQLPGMGLAQVFGYFILPVAVELAVVTMMFWIVPVARPKLRDAATGAVCCTILFELFKKIFSVYVVHYSGFQHLPGLLTALLVTCLWLYLNWMILLLCAEFTVLLSRARSGNSEDVPDFMLRLAQMTGSTMGADRLNKEPRRSKIRVHISKKIWPS